ncbi:MAG: hypothetical protein U0903_22065 [Planctomycetales bacterium]
MQPIHYCNTDLCLESAHDLTALASWCEQKGLIVLRVDQEQGHWTAWFEADVDADEPAGHITALLEAIEAFPEVHRETWDGCKTREFDMGFDCGDRPWAFHQEISAGLVNRIASMNASLRVTLYPESSSPPNPQENL